MLSPTVPVSVHDANAGVEGADGAIVSIRKLNGVMVLVECGASSLPVKVCEPSLSARVVWMHTFAYPSELNVPIPTPSMSTE
jgi:hypothetical protein